MKFVSSFAKTILGINHKQQTRLKLLARDNALAYLCSGLYYKPMAIVNDDAWIVNKIDASLTDDARFIIYDRHMFIVQATGASVRNK